MNSPSTLHRHPSSANTKFAKVRNGSTHQNSRPAPTHSHPTHATNTSVAYNAASNLTVPRSATQFPRQNCTYSSLFFSQPQVPQYSQFDTTQFYSNPGHKSEFNRPSAIAIQRSCILAPFYYEVPSGNNFPPVAHTAGANTQVPYQVPYHHTATGKSIFSTLSFY